MKGTFGQLILTTYGVKDYITVSTPAVTLNSWNIIAFRFNSNFSVDFDLNGRANSSNNYSQFENITGTTNATTQASTIMYLGSGPGTDYFNGSIAGIYAFTTAFSNSQHDLFVGMLSFMFGLNNILPSTHPYKYNGNLRNIALNMNNLSITNLQGRYPGIYSTICFLFSRNADAVI